MIKSLYTYISGITTQCLPGSPCRLARTTIWRTCGIKIGNNANIMPGAKFSMGAAGTEISIGKETYIGTGTLITGGTIKIGNFCDIAPHCIIHAGSHMIGSNKRRAGLSISGNIEVGDGSWIGTGAIILAGAKIGSGTIVAAGSVVPAGSYPENCLIAGAPAAVKKTLP